MKQNNGNGRFGEVMSDSLYSYREKFTYNLPTEWGPKYESSREAADAAIKKYGLSEEDFWIKKELSQFKDKIIYTNLILSHSGCIKVNSQQPEEKQFKPGCVREARGTADGGIALIYSSDEQKLFKTGEASPRNSNVSYLYAVAEKRLFDRVVTALSGLYEEGIYGEDEADSFKKNRNVIPNEEPQPAEASAQTAKTETFPARLTAASVPAAPAAVQQSLDIEDLSLPEESPSSDFFLTDEVRARKIKDIDEGVRFTQTNMRTMLDYYGVFSVEEMSDKALLDCADKIATKVARRNRALDEAKKAIAATQPEFGAASAKDATDPGLSPIAAMLMSGSAETEGSQMQPVSKPAPAEVPIGQTIYAVASNAPQNFQELAGQTFDQIGKDLLRGLYKRQNAAGRKYVDADLLKKIEQYIA